MAGQGLDQLATDWGVSNDSSPFSSSQGSSLDALAAQWSAPKKTQAVSPKPTSKPEPKVSGNVTIGGLTFNNLAPIAQKAVDNIAKALSIVKPAPQATTKPVKLPSNIKLNFVDAPSGGQSGQTTITPNSIKQQAAQQQQIQKPVQQGVATLQKVGNRLMAVFPQTGKTIQDIKNIDPFSLKANPKKAVTDFTDTLTQAWNEYKQREDTQLKSINSNDSASKKTATTLLRISAGANLAFSPITGLFNAANDAPPLVGALAKAISVPFIALGEEGTRIGDHLINTLVGTKVLSPKDGEILRQGTQEIFSLAAQASIEGGSALGEKAMGRLNKKFGPEGAKTIVEQSQKLAEEKKKADQQPSKPFSPQEIRDKVFQLGIENTAIGKGIIKAAAQAEKEGKYIQEGELSKAKGLTAPSDLLVSHEGAPDVKTVEQYKSDIQAGKDIEPVKVIREGEKYGIEDGKHRYQAYKELGIKDIPIEVVRKNERVGLSGEEQYRSTKNTESLKERIKRDPNQSKNIQIEGDKVRIYRGMPKEKRGLLPEDRVSFSESYSKSFAKTPEHLISELVPLEDIHIPKGSATTQGFYRPKSAPDTSLVVQGPEELKRLKYDPEKLEKRVVQLSYGKNEGKFEAQIRYKGFAADKKAFDTKQEAERFIKNYEFKGLNKSVADDYEGTSIDPFKRNGKEQKLYSKEDISPAGRIKTASIDKIFDKIPEETKDPKGLVVKREGKLFPTEKVTKEMLDNAGIKLNKDGSYVEGLNVNKIRFTEDVALNRAEIKPSKSVPEASPKAQEGMGKGKDEGMPIKKQPKVLTGKEVEAIRDIIKAKFEHIRELSGSAEEYSKGLDDLIKYIHDNAGEDKQVLSAFHTELNKEMYGMAGGATSIEQHANLMTLIKEDPENGPILAKMYDEKLRLQKQLTSSAVRSKRGAEQKIITKTEKATGGAGTPNPVGEGKPRESEAFRKFVEQLKEADPKRYEELKDNKVTYNRLNLEKDAQNAMKLIEEDPDRAYRISKGYEAPPEGQTETAISIGLANRAGIEKNFDMQADLESSRSLRQTRRGQEIVSERGRFTENSPHALIQRVLDDRLKRIGKDYVTTGIDTVKAALKQKADTVKARAIAKIDEQVEKAVKYTKKERSKIRSAQNLLDELTCK